jgi:hypothetical protein
MQHLRKMNAHRDEQWEIAVTPCNMLSPMQSRMESKQQMQSQTTQARYPPCQSSHRKQACSLYSQWSTQPIQEYDAVFNGLVLSHLSFPIENFSLCIFSLSFTLENPVPKLLKYDRKEKKKKDRIPQDFRMRKQRTSLFT